MKKHTTKQLIRKLREAETLASQGKNTAAICQALGISSQTYHRWKARYGRLDGDEAKRLRQLEEENQRLRRLVAEQGVDGATWHSRRTGRIWRAISRTSRHVSNAERTGHAPFDGSSSRSPMGGNARSACRRWKTESSSARPAK